MKRRERKRIDNKEFRTLLIEYSVHSEKTPKDKIPDPLGQMVDDLIYNIETSASFNRYTYRDEMRSEARKNCFSAITHQKFDIDRINPFGYFTTIIMRSFFKVISDEKKVGLIKNAVYEEHRMLHSGNTKFDSYNEQHDEAYKTKEIVHSEWLPLKVTVNGKERIFQTQKQWEDHVEKKRKRKEEKALAEAQKQQ